MAEGTIVSSLKANSRVHAAISVPHGMDKNKRPAFKELNVSVPDDETWAKLSTKGRVSLLVSEAKALIQTPISESMDELRGLTVYL